jgi:hypothetical protein
VVEHLPTCIGPWVLSPALQKIFLKNFKPLEMLLA